MDFKSKRGPAARMDQRGPGRQHRRVTTGLDWNKLDWVRLAAYVIRHRQLAGYKDAKALYEKAKDELSYKTILRVEGATQPVSRETLGVIERYLRWKPGSAVAVLRGGEPTLEDTGDASPTALAELRAASREELDRVHALVGVVLGADIADAWLQKATELRSAGASSGTSSPQTTRREVG